MNKDSRSLLNKVLKLIFDLSVTDLEIFETLLREFDKRKEPLSVLDIVTVTGKSRSTVERSLFKLFTMGLVERKAVLARSGGYTYVYFPKPMDEIREILKLRLDEFCSNVKRILDETEMFKS